MITYKTKLIRDHHNPTPDKTMDEFWPTRENCPPEVFDRETVLARQIYDDHRAGKWWYVGVCVQMFKGSIALTGPYDFALWGVESNNLEYHREIAAELAQEAMPSAKRELARQLRFTRHRLTELQSA